MATSSRSTSAVADAMAWPIARPERSTAALAIESPARKLVASSSPVVPVQPWACAQATVLGPEDRLDAADPPARARVVESGHLDVADVAGVPGRSGCGVPAKDQTAADPR